MQIEPGHRFPNRFFVRLTYQQQHYRMIVKVVGRMKRFAFYKTYYKMTNRIYADHIIWSAENREQARRKGQIYISKAERGILVAAQYLFLLAAGISFAVGNYQIGIVCCAVFPLCSLITDFSILKIEMLYHLFSLDNPYSALLYQVFLGKANDFWCLTLPGAKKKVSGFVRMNRNKFVAKYSVVFRIKREIVTVIITPFHIRIKSETRNIVIKDAAATLPQIADSISEILNAL